ncbi:hypothetical protein BKE17_02155 [Enhydrobacter sp. H5]|uniref:Transposase n=1 Tax=Enhydrobacter aerosaccus TaxID=225324 RepID=A0ABR5IQA2_9HYPH|nr:hypothetical protein AFK20_02230 [Enhydrobacter aerosaccus]ONG40120.1 hypothetical protein BKE17_02155 [Enhydrobacter sp. H5]VXB00838.1 conserved hypothetical protein [Enhydrobacter sp. AX1]
MVWEETVRLQLAALKTCSSYLFRFNRAMGFQIAINANIRYHGLSFIMPANPIAPQSKKPD